jgi:hypothetical protein
MTSRPSAAAPILASLAIVLAVLWAYVGGYFWLGDCLDWALEGVVRSYRSSWQVAAFTPAAFIESTIRRCPVHCIEK